LGWSVCAPAARKREIKGTRYGEREMQALDSER
jgi:hypothetical protein